MLMSAGHYVAMLIISMSNTRVAPGGIVYEHCQGQTNYDKNMCKHTHIAYG